jgi:hypothetical protein
VQQEEEQEEEEAKEVDRLSPYLPPSLPASPVKISFLMPSLFFLCYSTIF